MRRLVAVVVVVLALAVGASAQTNRRPSESGKPVVGTWSIAGVNPDGSKYEMEAIVTELQDGRTVVTYLQEGMAVAGCGIVRSGDRYAIGCEPTSIGMFRLKGKNLVGEWIVPGAQGAGTEVWKRIERLTPPKPAPPREPVGHPGVMQVGPGIKL